MRTLSLATMALLAASTLCARAQTTPPPVVNDGARPGHVVGQGDSLPLSTKASNITPANSPANAPTLPQPSIGQDATVDAYLRIARKDLAAGQTGAGQQALEMAETRALDRVVQPGEDFSVSHNTRIAQMTQARQALGHGDKSGAIHLIDAALAD